MELNIMQSAIVAMPFVLLGLGIAFAAVACDLSRKGETPLVQTGLATMAFALALFSCGFDAPIAEAATPSNSAAIEASAVQGGNDGAMRFGNDLMWAGNNALLSGETVGNDLLAAGQTIEVRDSKVAGSVRAAGQTVVLSDVFAKQNVTLAGQSVSVGGGECEAAALVGQNASFNGKANALHAAAQVVTINGVVHGDVQVSAERLEIGPGAVVDGTICGTVGSDPVVADGASVGKMDVTIDENAKESIKDDLGEGLGAAASALAGFSWLGALLGILGFVLMALLCEWIGRKQTADALAMAQDRAASLVGSGVVAAFVAPIVLVLLCCTMVGIPVAVALACALGAIQMVGGGFAAATLAKRVFPNMGRFVAATAGGTILGVVSLVPFVGWLVPLASFVFLLGYVLQRVYLGPRGDGPALEKVAQP